MWNSVKKSFQDVIFSHYDVIMWGKNMVHLPDSVKLDYQFASSKEDFKIKGFYWKKSKHSK